MILIIFQCVGSVASMYVVDSHTGCGWTGPLKLIVSLCDLVWSTAKTLQDTAESPHNAKRWKTFVYFQFSIEGTFRWCNQYFAV